MSATQIASLSSEIVIACLIRGSAWQRDFLADANHLTNIS